MTYGQFMGSMSFEQHSLVMLAGPSGAGKSTLAARMFPTVTPIEADHVRQLVSDDPSSQAVNADVFDLVGRLARARARAGRPVVIDSTALRPADRFALLELAMELERPAHLVVVSADARDCARAQRAAGRRVRVDDHVIDLHQRRLADTLAAWRDGSLQAEGFDSVHVLTRAQAATVSPVTWVASRAQELDIVGDVHGCASELIALLGELGYELVNGAWQHPDGRQAVFVGDLMDRGPGNLEVLELVWNMTRRGSGLIGALGNHDWKAYRGLILGRDIDYNGGFWRTAQEIEEAVAADPGAAPRIERMVCDLFATAPSHSVLCDGRVVVTHAGLRRDEVGAVCGLDRNDPVSERCLYGEHDGRLTPAGYRMRSYDWADTWTDDTLCVYGHDVAGTAPLVRGPNQTVIGIDTGCCFGGTLTALRYPEMEAVSVGALRRHADDCHEVLTDVDVEPLNVISTEMAASNPAT